MWRRGLAGAMGRKKFDNEARHMPNLVGTAQFQFSVTFLRVNSIVL
jgi:hypothetical protein